MNRDTSIRYFPKEPNNRWNGSVWDDVIEPLKTSFPEITPFQTKVLYIFGMIRHMLEAAGWTFKTNNFGHSKQGKSSPPFLFATYLLASGAVELMGRCILTNSEWAGKLPIKSNRPLVRGLEWVSQNYPGFNNEEKKPKLDLIVVSVGKSPYTVKICKNFRNSLAHGAAYFNEDVLLTPTFMKSFMNQTCQRIDDYYNALFDDSEIGEILRNRLSQSRIEPFEGPDGIIHVRFLYESLLKPPYGSPCGELLHQNSWRVN